MSELPKILKLGEGAESVRALVGQAKVIQHAAVVDCARAAALLASAQVEASKRLQAAKEEETAIRLAAYEAGKAEGYREVIEELAKVRVERRELHRVAEQDLVELAFRVAAQILGREVERDPAVVTNVVRTALESARGRRNIVVHIHPEDAQLVELSRDRLESVVEGTRIHFDLDPDITRGGCIIDTEGGQIHAELSSQLTALQKKLEGK